MGIATAPRLEELISDVGGAERAERFTSYKNALDDSALVGQARAAKGSRFITDGQNGPEWTGIDAGSDPAAMLGKAMTADDLDSVRAELTKTISLTSPLSSGLVAYDLEAPAKFLAPRLTPLRNIIPRIKGVGKARQYKRITGITNSGTGGVANQRIGITDTSTATFGSLVLKRGAKISYAADEATLIYVQAGVSDEVLWSADFAGQGYQDIRQLSQTAILAAHMRGEELMLLGGRGTLTGYAGALAAPTAGNVTLTSRNAAGAEVGNSANIANLYVFLTAECVQGESAASTVVSSTSLSAATGKVVDVTMTGAPVPGATGYRVYVGTANAIATAFYVGRTGFWGGTAGAATAAFTIQFGGAGTGGAPTVANGVAGPAADNSATATEYDGVLTHCLGGSDGLQSGYVGNVGGKLSTSNPGVELQNAFLALWNKNKSNPDDAWFNGADSKQLSDTFKIGGTGNATFFYAVDSTPGDMTVGTKVTGVLNEVTGKTVAVRIHPDMPQGNVAIVSYDVPIEDSQISSCFQWVGPQDYMAIDWPVIQHSYDVGTYQFGALMAQADVFQGALTGIQSA